MDQFDAIMFHTFRMSEKPPSITRKSFQRYIMFDLESPDRVPLSKYYNNFFNLTMTYRLESDIARTYGWFQPISSDNRYPLSDVNKLSLSYPAGNGKKYKYI